MKEISLYDSIYDLVNTNPEIKQVLYDIGFKDITKKGMIETVGRFMTLDKGTRTKGMSLDHIINKLSENGFTVKK